MRRLRQHYFHRSRGVSLTSLLAGIALIFFAGCNKNGSGAIKETQIGLASYYGPGLQGEKTSSGELFNKDEMVAAHPKYPMGTRVRVTNLENEHVVDVRVIDRGPTQNNQAEGVIIDVSEGAAAKLDILKDGRARVRVDVMEWGSNSQK